MNHRTEVNLMIRLLSVLLAVVLLMTAFGGCSFVDKFQGYSGNPVSEQEISRLVVGSVSEKSNVTNNYSLIPEIQRDDVSLSYFSEYVDIIRRITVGRGKIAGFRIRSFEDTKEILDGYVSDYEVTNFVSEDNVKAVEILFEENLESSSVYFFIGFKNDGVPSLNSDWIKKTISLYNYAEHYFNMVESANYEALSELLTFQYDSDIYTDEVLLSKASAIIDFYKYRVRESAAEFELLCATPFCVGYKVPSVISKDGTSISSEVFSAVMHTDESVTMNDIVHQTLSSNAFNLYNGDFCVLRIGLSYNASRVISLLGTPATITTYGNSADDEYPVICRLSVIYPGLVLIFDAEYTDDSTWSGVLSSIKIVSSSSDFSIGKIKVGMNESDILSNYPFADEEGFVFADSSVGSNVSITYTFDSNGFITSIKSSIDN